ncbi:MAG: hypothetical protein ACFFAE_20880, partial [Candidatus Hodarchaeota archaeon]
ITRFRLIISLNKIMIPFNLFFCHNITSHNIGSIFVPLTSLGADFLFINTNFSQKFLSFEILDKWD